MYARGRNVVEENPFDMPYRFKFLPRLSDDRLAEELDFARPSFLLNTEPRAEYWRMRFEWIDDEQQRRLLTKFLDCDILVSPVRQPQPRREKRTVNTYYEEWLKLREEYKKRYRACRAEGFAIPPEWSVWRAKPKLHACFFCLAKTPSACSLRKKEDKSLVGYVCHDCMVKTRLRSFIVDSGRVKDSGPQKELVLR